jgi:AraC family ethanolamine operon transcriptional activator
VTVLPDAALIDRLSDAMYGSSFARLCQASAIVRTSDGAVGACARHFAQIVDTAADDEAPLRQWITAAGGAESFVRECIDEVLGIVCVPAPARGWSSRRTVVDRAWDIVEDNDDGLITVTGLCELLGVPIRTLDDAFHACIGITPKRFILSLRLNKARRALARAHEATSITETATRFGFFHFGHFARQYCRLFGELPSETLHRARGRARPPARPAATRLRAA